MIDGIAKSQKNVIQESQLYSEFQQLIKGSKYKIPSSTFFKQYKSNPEALYGKEFHPSKKIHTNTTETPSDLQGYDLVFAKLNFSADKLDFELL